MPLHGLWGPCDSEVTGRSPSHGTRLSGYHDPIGQSERADTVKLHPTVCHNQTFGFPWGGIACINRRASDEGCSLEEGGDLCRDSEINTPPLQHQPLVCKCVGAGLGCCPPPTAKAACVPVYCIRHVGEPGWITLGQMRGCACWQFRPQCGP